MTWPVRFLKKWRLPAGASADRGRAREEADGEHRAADEVGEQVGAYLDAGLDGVIWNMPTVHVLDDVAYAGEVLGKILT